LAVVVAIAASAFVAAPSGASPSWTAIPGGVALPRLGQGRGIGAHASPAGCYNHLCEYLAGMAALGSVSTGVTASFNQPRPKVVPGERSLTALGIESKDGNQGISFGWMVSKRDFHDTVPHIVVSAVVNGAPTCINGCGFIPVVKKEPKVAPGHVGKYTIKLSKARWLIVYNNKTLGFYPTSMWRANKLARSYASVAFGEVASPSKTTPRSDMGNGRFGTDARSAKIMGMKLLGAKGTPTFDYVAVDAPTKYTIGFTNPVCHTGCSMNYGGPGF
jgi:hypothetical protein